MRSASPDDVVKHIADAVKKGAREIYLTGQDVITYGYEAKWARGGISQTS